MLYIDESPSFTSQKYLLQHFTSEQFFELYDVVCSGYAYYAVVNNLRFRISATNMMSFFDSPHIDCCGMKIFSENEQPLHTLESLLVTQMK